MFGPIGPIPPNPRPLFTITITPQVDQKKKTITPQSPISATSLFLEEASQRERAEEWLQRLEKVSLETERARQIQTRHRSGCQREKRGNETRVEITMAQRDSATIHAISAAKAAVRLKRFATSSSVAARGHSALQQRYSATIAWYLKPCIIL